MTNLIQPNQVVRVMSWSGQPIDVYVTSTAYRGTELLSIGGWCPAFGPNRRDDARLFAAEDVML
jgi:hypothetical protein